MPDALDQLHRDLQRAESALRAWYQQERRVLAAATDLERAAAELAAAQVDLAHESADVRALTSFSPTRILAGLRGDREALLSREQAEMERASYAVALAEHSRQRAESALTAERIELAELRGERRLLARREVALAAIERGMVRHETASAGELNEITRLSADLEGQELELRAAFVEATAAAEVVGDAVRLLREARDASDVLVRRAGNLVTAVQQSSRLDKVERLLHQCRDLLAGLELVLAPLHLDPAFPHVRVGSLLAAGDAWTNGNRGVHDRIVETDIRIGDVLVAVEAIRVQLKDRHSETLTRLSGLRTRREVLLRG